MLEAVQRERKISPKCKIRQNAMKEESIGRCVASDQLVTVLKIAPVQEFSRVQNRGIASTP
jgi:hypothetical protein